MRKNFRTIAALTGLVLGSHSLSWAATSDWIGVQDSTFGSAGNWDNGVPGENDTGVFMSAAPLAITITTDTTIGGLTFNTMASAYSITLATSATLNINGAGLDNHSSSVQTFTTAPGGVINFNGSSSASSSTIINVPFIPFLQSGRINFNDSSSASSATIVNNAGETVFNATSSAGNAKIQNIGAGGYLYFEDASSAGNAIISSNGGATFTEFENEASADNVTITNSNGARTYFWYNTSANNATITNNGSGLVIFEDNSTASSSTLTNNGGGTITFNGAFQSPATAENSVIQNVSGGMVDFANVCTAGNAQITNVGSGTVQFDNFTTASSATITNNGGGLIQFNTNSTAANATINSTNGMSNFTDTTNAGTSLITNNAGASVNFSTAASAANATIINNNSSANFAGVSNAGNSSITNNGSLSIVQFNDASNAGNSTLTNQGGLIQFNNNSNGGSATVVNNSGTVDVSKVGDSQLTVGSIAGNGFFTLGSTQLTSGGNGLDTMVTGVISGTGGSLVKVGTGTLTLAGTNTYTGGTMVDAGTLSIGSDANLGAAGSALTLSNGSTLQTNAAMTTTRVITLNTGGESIDTDGFDSNFTGTLQGSGALVKAGEGTLTVSGTNTYLGGTMIDAGVLRTGSANALPSSGTVVLANTSGARLDLNGFNQTVGSLSGGGTSGGDVTLGSATLTAGGDNTSVTYAGSISGTGSLLKVGDGTLTLTGDNIYTGMTMVTSGTLDLTGSLRGDAVIAPGANFSNVGTMGGIINRGTVTPGINGVGTLTVSDYSGPGTLHIIFDKASHNALNVTGSAMLAGGSLNITDTQFVSGTYSILTASSVVGAFASINEPASSVFLTLNTAYTPTAVEVVVKALSFSDLSQTGNQHGVAAALDAARPTATGNFATTVQALYALPTADQARAAVSQLSGDSLASFQNSGMRGAQVFTQQMNQRAAPMADATSLAGLNTPIQLAYAGDLIHSDLNLGNGVPTHSSPTSTYGLWSRGMGFFDHVNGNSAMGSPGSDSTTSGFQVGYDTPLTDDVLFGFSGGYATTSLSVDDRSSSGNSTSIQSGVYASYTPGPWFINASMAYTTSANNLTRPIQFTGINETASANFQSRVYTSFLEAGYDLKPRKYFSLQPSVSLRHSHLQQNAFTETGAPGLDLTVQDQTVDSLVSAMGARLTHRFRAHSSNPFTIGMRAAWEHELDDTDNSITAQFTEAPGSAFSVQATPRSRNAAALGLDGNVNLSKNLQGFVNYSATLSSEQETQGFFGGLRINW